MSALGAHLVRDWNTGRRLNVPGVAKGVTANAIPGTRRDIAGINVGQMVLAGTRPDRALPAGNLIPRLRHPRNLAGVTR